MCNYNTSNTKNARLDSERFICQAQRGRLGQRSGFLKHDNLGVKLSRCQVA